MLEDGVATGGAVKHLTVLCGVLDDCHFRRTQSLVAFGSGIVEIDTIAGQELCALALQGTDAAIAVNRDAVPTEMVEHEKEMIKNEIKNDPKNASKTEDILDKMATGRLSKFFKENCLVEQDFIKDSSMTVGKYAEANGCEVLSMVIYAVGECIEKRQENFAEEVAAQIDAAN